MDDSTNPAARKLRFRKLRIAWSVGWGLLAVLLIMLWVRSYSHISFVWRVSSTGVNTRFESANGGVAFLYGKVVGDERPRGWESFSLPIPRKMPETHHRPTARNSPFKLDWLAGKIVIGVPYWLLFIGSGIFAALPWLPGRFSLRTLLIATTLVAVVLGIIIYAAHR
jgi:hypothetical protein